MDHFRDMAHRFKPSANRWDAQQEEGNDVDSDEWSDSGYQIKKEKRLIYLFILSFFLYL